MVRFLALSLALAGGGPVAAAGPPDWVAPAPGAYPEAMAVTGVVQVSGVELRSSSDRVAAFVGGEIRGVAAPTLVGSRRIFFLTVAGTAGDGVVAFRAYDAAGDRVLDLQPDLTFTPANPEGSAVAPLVWTPLVGGGSPVWSPTPADFDGSMSVTARVVQGGAVVEDARVGAFVDGEVRGAAPVQDVGALGALAFLTVYGDPSESAPIAFRVYLPSTDRTYAVVETVALAVGTSAGSLTTPVTLTMAPGPTLSGAEGWRMLAPPGVDATPALLLGPIWTQGYPGAGDDGGDPNVYRYDEPTATYTPPTAASEAWARGTGRFVYVFADDDPRTPATDGGFPKALPSVGIGPSGPFTFSLTRTPGNGASEGPGWNLLGNPFGEAVDWDGGWTRTDVSESVYVWDPNHLGGSYRVWNGTVGSLTDGEIPAGNGFWVEATGASPSVSVPESARIGDVAVVRRRAEPEVHAVALRLASDDRLGLGAESYVTFRAGAAGPEVEGDPFDAWVLAPLVAEHLTLGSAARADGRLLAIDARLPMTGGTVDIPLAVASVGHGDGPEAVRLSWPDLAVPDEWTVRLVDTETGTETDLRRETSYAFSLAASASSQSRQSAVALPGPHGRSVQTEPRFVLRLASSAVSSEAEPEPRLNLTAPWPNPARSDATVTFTLAESAEVRLALVNALGQVVAVLADGPHLAGRHQRAVPLEGVAAGVYLLRLDAGGDVRTRRLTVIR